MKSHLKPPSHVRGKKAGRTAATAAVTLTASAGLLMGGLFASPNDLLQNETDSAAPAAIVQTLNDEPINTAQPEQAAQEDPSEQDRRKRGWKTALRERILQLPFGVRAAVCVPLWGVGWVLNALLSALWAHVLSPVLGTFAGWLTLAAVILACLVGIVKTAFPDLPVKKILNRRTVCIVLALVTLCTGLDAILPEVWDGYEALRSWLRFAGATAILAVGALPFFRKNLRNLFRRKKSAA